ncbi:MAG: fasciclin domain-containing protein [Bacteroidota bacterium]
MTQFAKSIFKTLMVAMTLLWSLGASAQSVYDVVVNSADHNTLEVAIDAAQLDGALDDPSAQFTLFAPTDAAFAALGSVVNDLVTDNPTGQLADILRYHVLAGEVPATDVTNGLIATPLNNANTLKFTRTIGGNVFVNQAQVTVTDVPATNGVVHVIDAVVLPVETVADVAIDNDFSTLVTAVVAAELLPALTDPAGTYTVFAPTNDAFGALGGTVNDLLADPTGQLQDILLYHVLGTEVAAENIENGQIVDALSTTNTLKLTKTTTGDVFVNQAQVSMANVGADNGIVHVLDAVVLPNETVADVAIDNGFTTLVTAVAAAELLPALTNPAGTYTVFAPTNDAFGELGDDVNTLLETPTGQLRDILLYHVLGAEVMAGDVTNGLITDPLNAENTLKFTATSMGDVFVNHAQVINTDIDGGNGIVHVINKVVMPSETVVDVAIDNGFSTLTTAVVAAELLPALTDPMETYTVFAPTNDAFAALGDAVNTLLEDPTGDLRNILLYHVLGAEVMASDVTNGLITDALNTANTLKFTRTTMGNVFINQAQITGTDIDGGNGIVHIIDGVVMPTETVVDVAIDNGFTTLTSAVVAAELLPALTNPMATYTVFAPTDDAFAALGDAVNTLLEDPTGDLQDILLYHVLGAEVEAADITNGQIADALNTDNTLKLTKTTTGDVFVNQAQVTMANVESGNGIVHVINGVVQPIETVADVAIDNDFSTLVTAVAAAELLPALTDPAGTYTVFAPTNDAFAALGDGINDLLADPTGDLRTILLGHVLGTAVTSDQLTNGDVPTLAPGFSVTVDLTDGVMINNATVVQADVEAANGVVHVINEVIEGIVNVDEQILRDMQIYPNPTVEFINVNAVDSNYEYAIFDLAGKVVQNGDLLQGDNRIDLSILSSGTYLMKIQDGERFATARIVVGQ